MAKFSALFLAIVAITLSVSQAIRYLNCNRSNEGHIFVRSGLSVYRCHERREKFVGCLYSKSNSGDTVYGFSENNTKEFFDSPEDNLFTVGRRNLTNCCALSKMEDLAPTYGGLQSTIEDLVKISKKEEVPFNADGVDRFTLLSNTGVTFPLKGICKADSSSTKKIYTNHQSALYKCVGDELVKQDVCAFAVNGTTAIRCEKKDVIKTKLTELFLDFDTILDTDTDFCCKVNDRLDDFNDLVPHLKACNDVI